MKPVDDIVSAVAPMGVLNFAALELCTNDEVLALLAAADDEYFNSGNVLISDDVYDAVKQYARAVSPTAAYFTGIGSAVRGGKVRLPFVMGSLNQIYQGDYVKWITKSHASQAALIASHKLDGTSGMIIYDKHGSIQIGYSRGDGIEGADITRHLLQLASVPKRVSEPGLAVRGEMIISKQQFARVAPGVKTRSGKQYKNPRNMVAGLMNASSNVELAYSAVEFIAYSIEGSTLPKDAQLLLLTNLGFKVVDWQELKPAGQVTEHQLTALLNDWRDSSEYELDGVVLEFNDPGFRLNASDKSSLNPDFAVKYKVADASNYAETVVTGVKWAITKDGYLKPTIQFNPVDLKGVTIQNTSGFNAKFIADNEIGEQAVIGITRAGDVTPFCQTVVSPSPFGAQLPDVDCVWTETRVDLRIIDASNNKQVALQRLIDFFTSIGVEHLGEGHLQRFVDVGVLTPEEIILMSEGDVSLVVGSQANGKKIFASIQQRLTDIPMHVLMGSHNSMGRGVGVRKMKKLAEAFNGDMTQCQYLDRVIAVPGFRVKTASKVADGYAEFMEFFSKIASRVTLKQYQQSAGALAGQTIVVTGFRDKQFETAIESRGGKIGSSVSKNTTIVVAVDTSAESTKLIKARQLGIRLMSKNEFSAEFGC